MEAHKKNNCVKRVVSCRLGCYKNMKEEDREYHETWECKQRQVYCSLGCGFQIQEVRRKLHEKCDCRLRFVECPNGCRETMRFEDLDFHMSNQCSHREYHPPKEDWKCSRCNMKNLKNKMILSYGDDVFAWKCQVCKNAYAKKGLKVVDVLKHKYSLWSLQHLSLSTKYDHAPPFPGAGFETKESPTCKRWIFLHPSYSETEVTILAKLGFNYLQSQNQITLNLCWYISVVQSTKKHQ